MAALTSLLVAYVLGGITFLPLLAAAIFLHAYLTLPPAQQAKAAPKPSDDLDDIKDEKLKEKLQHSSHEPEAAAGYFAVCREYVPGGVNGKPPERTTPAGETIAAESPSVYQSIYRSVFERGKTQTPSFEAGKSVKRARNVFYVVLRHGHLVLFDNAEQLEVRHVIALNNYDVDIYGGGDFIPEGELFIKRNSLRLSQKTLDASRGFSPKPFYLFSENCSAKEDMYFSILHNQERRSEATRNPPTTQDFETDDMISLIRHLHLSEHVQQQRWFNAMIGRVFLGLYKTPHLEHTIRAKMNKKMSRVSKPAFITSLKLGDLDMGHSAPHFSNMKLRECTVDGDVTVEMDVRYNGHMKIVVAAVARIELGSRLKPREVNLVLATTLKMLDGHLLLRIKPPPSNRLWFSFETMPKMDLSIEPILSSRQITYSVVTRAIESRLKEVLAETLVSPFWDDIPFSNTNEQTFRGGIWKHEKKTQDAEQHEKKTQDSEQHETLPSGSQSSPSLAGVDLLASDSPTDTDALENVPALPARAASMPAEPPVDGQVTDDGGYLRDDVPGTPTSVESAPAGLAAQHAHSYKRLGEKPKALRASSFTTAATAVVSNNSARVSSPQNQLRRRAAHPDATSAMKMLTTQSPETSPTASPVGSASREAFVNKARSNSLEHVTSPTNGHRRSSSGPVNYSAAAEAIDFGATRQILPGIDESSSPSTARKSALSAALATKPASDAPSDTQAEQHRAILSAERKAAINQSMNSAAAAAKSWGLGVLQRQMEARSPSDKTSASSALAAKTLRNTGEPMGRGQPLPPPGQPLPKPKPDTWSSLAMNSLRRKPVAAAAGGHARKTSLQSNPDADVLVASDASSKTESRRESVQSHADSVASSRAESRKDSVQSYADSVASGKAESSKAELRRESAQSHADSIASSRAELRKDSVQSHADSVASNRAESRKDSTQSYADSVASSRAESSRAAIGKAESSRAELSKAESSKAELSRAELSKAESSKAESSKAESSKAESSMADLNKADSSQESTQPVADSTVSSRGASVPASESVSSEHLPEAMGSTALSRQAETDSTPAQVNAAPVQVKSAETAADKNEEEPVLQTPSPPPPTFARNESNGS